MVVLVPASQEGGRGQEVPQWAEIEHTTSQRPGEARAFTVKRRRREGRITDMTLADAGVQSRLDQLQLDKEYHELPDLRAGLPDHSLVACKMERQGWLDEIQARWFQSGIKSSFLYVSDYTYLGFW